jgi:anaerobic selenocysteine-containing dehydrogenase
MCGLAIDVDGDRILSIEGDDQDPLSRGHVCPKAPALKELHEDPDRLRHPLRKTKSGHERISWEAAFEEVADRLHETQVRYGRDSAAIYIGNPNAHNSGVLVFGPLFLRTLRTKNRYSASSVDQLPHMLAGYSMWGHQLLLPVPDIDRTKLWIILGGNPLASNGSLMSAPDVKTRLRAIQSRGGRVVVVDPRRTETAAIASEHVPIRPGTDALLLFAILNVVFEDRRVDLAHLGSHVKNLDTLEGLARRFSPERVAAATGIAAPTIRRLAREICDTKEAVLYGRIGTSTQAFGSICQWLINAINIVTGHFDRPGGAMFTSPALDPLKEVMGMGLGRGSYGRWKSKVRGLPEFGGELPVAALAEEITHDAPDRIRALVTVAGNPVLSTPNGRGLARAFEKLDFMVSVDIYLNETTRHADIVLPSVSPLERSHYSAALHLFAIRNSAKWSPALFERPVDARHDWEIVLELTERLERRRGRKRAALAARALRALGPDRVIDLGLRFGAYGRKWPSRKPGLSLRALRNEPHGIDLGALDPCFLERRPTEDPIDLAPPVLVEDVKRLERELDDGSNGYRLIGRRHLRSNNSWMHNLEKLSAGKNRCTLLVHPDDVIELGLETGGRARVRSRAGEVVVEVEASADMMRGVVSLPHGFGHDEARLRVASKRPGASANDLTDELLLDAPSGNAALSGVSVTIAPA